MNQNMTEFCIFTRKLSIQTLDKVGVHQIILILSKVGSNNYFNPIIMSSQYNDK